MGVRLSQETHMRIPTKHMNSQKQLAPSASYIRTSSAANVGADKDSEKRQRIAIQNFAERAGFSVALEFFDAAVSGSDPIETRPGFAALLEWVEKTGSRVVLVEDASRFARSLVAQELGLLVLERRGVRVITANGDDLTASDDPLRVAQRQIAGAFMQLEKSRLTLKLKSARERTRAANGGKCEGRRSHNEMHPELVAEVKLLRRRRPKGGQRSYREIAKVLAAKGHLNANGRPYDASSIRSMLIRQSLGRGDPKPSKDNNVVRASLTGAR
jgi:DNA invertase Pin-like site-specific DNA recombinase